MRLLLFLLLTSTASASDADGRGAYAAGSSETREDDEESGKRRGTSQAPTALALDEESGAQLIAGAAIEAALERGLGHLSERLETQSDGSLPCTQGDDHSPVGVTALGALAFMAAGNTPGRGPHGPEVERMVRYLLSRVTSGDEAHAGYVTDERDRNSRMHGHGLATLALAQAYEASPTSPRGRRIASALEAAVDLIEGSQSLEGGWYYDPGKGTQHEGSITVCVLQALRAARNCGVHVEPQVIARALDYLGRLQDETGGFMYALSEPRTSVALTGACLASMHATGTYDGKVVEEGYAFIWRELALRDEARARGLHAKEPLFPYYERFYLAQALWQHRDRKTYEEWARRELERVLGSQNEDGSWSDLRHDDRGRSVRERYGSSYATSMNCLFLALPGGVLPILQR